MIDYREFDLMTDEEIDAAWANEPQMDPEWAWKMDMFEAQMGDYEDEDIAGIGF